LTANTPDGTTFTPLNIPASQSALAASFDSPACGAASPLNTVSATLHTVNIAPRAWIFSKAIPGKRSSPSLAYAYGLRSAGALVTGSLIFSISPSLYFAHMLSLNASGIAKCRRPTTAVMSLSGTLYVSPIVFMNVIANENGKPSFTDTASKNWRYVPVMPFSQSSTPMPGLSIASAPSVRGSMAAMPIIASVPAPSRPRKPRRCVEDCGARSDMTRLQQGEGSSVEYGNRREDGIRFITQRREVLIICGALIEA